MYIQNVLNTVLYECELWTLNKREEQLLVSFQYRMLRKVLKLTMRHVEIQHINNEHVRNAMQIPHIICIVRC